MVSDIGSLLRVSTQHLGSSGGTELVIVVIMERMRSVRLPILAAKMNVRRMV